MAQITFLYKDGPVARAAGVAFAPLILPQPNFFGSPRVFHRVVGLAQHRDIPCQKSKYKRPPSIGDLLGIFDPTPISSNRVCMCVCQMIPSLPFHVNDRANNMKVGSIQNTRRIFIPSPPASLPSYENIFNAGISSFMRHALTKVHPSFCASTPPSASTVGGA